MERNTATTTSPARATSAASGGNAPSTAKASSSASLSSDIKLLMRKPGEIIRSEDWNRLVEELIALRLYVNNMSESTHLTGLQSAMGRGFEVEPVGLITRQWIPASADVPSPICSFAITNYFEVAQYWARSDNGNRNTVDIFLEYDDRTVYKAGEGLFINSTTELGGRDPTSINPYLEYIQVRSDDNWYKYQVKNKFPNKEVRFIRFVNVNQDCTPRIGNVLLLRSRITPLA